VTLTPVPGTVIVTAAGAERACAGEAFAAVTPTMPAALVEATKPIANRNADREGVRMSDASELVDVMRFHVRHRCHRPPGYGYRRIRGTSPDRTSAPLRQPGITFRTIPTVTPPPSTGTSRSAAVPDGSTPSCSSTHASTGRRARPAPSLIFTAAARPSAKAAA